MASVHQLIDQAVEFQNQTRFAEAEAAYLEVLARDPVNRYALFGVAFCRSAVGDRVGAKAAYRNAIAKDPWLQEAYLNLAKLEEGDKNIEEAIRLTQEVLKVKNINPTVWAWLGSLLMMVNRTNEAITALDKAVEQAPGNTPFIFQYYFILVSIGRVAAAQTLIKAAVQANRNDIQILQLAGEIAQQSGQLQEAVDYYSRVLQIDPSFPDAAMNLAMILDVSGRKEEATRLRAWALARRTVFKQKFPSDPSARKVLVLEAPEGGIPSAAIFPDLRYTKTRLVLQPGLASLPPEIGEFDFIVNGLCEIDHPLQTEAATVAALVGSVCLNAPVPTPQRARCDLQSLADGIDQLSAIAVTRVAAAEVMAQPTPMWIRPFAMPYVVNWVLVPDAATMTAVAQQLSCDWFDCAPIPAIQSADGITRVIRVTVIGRDIRPYRLLASRQPCIDPSGQLLAQDAKLAAEEKEIVDKSDRYFSPTVMEALQQFVQRLELDFAVLDIVCSEEHVQVLDVIPYPSIMSRLYSANLEHRLVTDMALLDAVDELVATKLAKPEVTV